MPPSHMPQHHRANDAGLGEPVKRLPVPTQHLRRHQKAAGASLGEPARRRPVPTARAAAKRQSAPHPSRIALVVQEPGCTRPMEEVLWGSEQAVHRRPASAPVPRRGPACGPAPGVDSRQAVASCPVLRAKGVRRSDNIARRPAAAALGDDVADGGKTARPPRVRSSPGGGSTAPTFRSLLPDLAALRLDPNSFDAEKHCTCPPAFLEGQLKGFFDSHDFKGGVWAIYDAVNSDTASDTLEEILLGSVDSVTERQVFLLWYMGVGLEALGEVEPAVRLFSKCLALDPSNPVHPYHRGACLLRLGRHRGACFDFDMAVARCNSRGLRPPLIFLASRARAGMALPSRRAEVWADFHLASAWARDPQLPLHAIRNDVGSYEDYCRTVQPMKDMFGLRHWVSSLVTRLSVQTLDGASEVEAAAFLRFLRGLPETQALTAELLDSHQREFEIRTVPPGVVLIPEDAWYCVIVGSFEILHFGPVLTEDAKQSPLGLQSGADVEGKCAASAIPPALLSQLRLHVDGVIMERETFFGRSPLGSSGDGWLVAAGDGVELLSLPCEVLRRLQRGSAPAKEQLDEQTALLASVPLFSLCSDRHLRMALHDCILETREAFAGEDVFCAWDGLLIVIADGQLRLFSTPPVSTPTCQELEVCDLGPGEVLGDEAILGGGSVLRASRTQVVSHRLRAWTLSPERLAKWSDCDARNQFMAGSAAGRRARQELQTRFRKAQEWSRERPRILRSMGFTWAQPRQTWHPWLNLVG